jgi:hypothetical protein
MLLEDPEGVGAAHRGWLATFPPALVERSREVLAAGVAAHDAYLARCARQGDGWLFHELLSPACGMRWWRGSRPSIGTVHTRGRCTSGWPASR